MSAPIGLNPKILEQVARELEKLRKEKKKVNAEGVVIAKLNSELRDVVKIMYSIQLKEKTELKRTLEEFKRFNEQVYRKLFGGR